MHRFLPPISKGAFTFGLPYLTGPTGWIIDPFGASPQMAVEIAQSGYKMLVTCNNPILQFYIELLCLAPTREDFTAALADFAFEKQETGRVETYLENLYLTRCPHCKSIIPAQSFIWRKDQYQLKLKEIHCKNCGTRGEFPVDGEDLQRLNSNGPDALHRSRAIQRVNINPDVQKAAEDVSEVYTARSLNFIFTFINRIERMDASPYHKKLLFAILIYLLDEGNSMWSWPMVKSRPKILSTPGQFRELNLWLAMEQGIEQWCSEKNPVDFTVWPEMPSGGSGICLYKGRISGFKAEETYRSIPFSLASTVFPRPNQAFWSLTAVWSGWLWGRNAVLPMKGALERRRFDWSWYTTAVHQTISGLQEILPSGTPFLGVISEAEIAFIASTFFAANQAGFTIKSCAMRGDEENIQIIWDDRSNASLQKSSSVNECYDSIKEFLLRRNEPSDELEVTTACLTNFSWKRYPSGENEVVPYQSIKDIQQEISTLLNDSGSFLRLQNLSGSQEKIVYWPNHLPPSPQPALSDRVETAFYNLISQTDQFTYPDIDMALCNLYPEFLTPASDLIKILFHSYTEEMDDQQGFFRIKDELREPALANKRDVTTKELSLLGSRLGYTIQPDIPQIWSEKDDAEPVISFCFLLSAAISPYLYNEPQTGLQVVVFPDNLSNLVEFKKKTNPLLGFPLKNQCRILSYEKLLDFSHQEALTKPEFIQILENRRSDQQGPSQISIFPI